MPPASASRAGVTPEASRDRSSGTFAENIYLAMTHYFRFSAFLCILSSTAMANGLLIYKEQGFHTDQQAKMTEYVTADIIPQMVTVTLKTGKKLDVPAGKSPVAIPFVKQWHFGVLNG